jgi:hypothetical protein
VGKVITQTGAKGKGFVSHAQQGCVYTVKAGAR